MYGFQDVVVERIEHMSDIAIRLESFAGSAKETNPLFKDYHGLLYINKLAALNTLAPQCPQFRDLAFKLRRKKFIIEVSRFYGLFVNIGVLMETYTNSIFQILHLPPEFADTAQREQDDAISSTGCVSGSRKSALDF